MLEMDEQRKVRSRAVRVIEFMRSEFWLKDLGPYLKDHQKKLAVGALWSPKSPNDMERTALCNAFNGGRYEEVTDQMQQFAIWEEEGVIAADRVKKLGNMLESNAKGVKRK